MMGHRVIKEMLVMEPFRSTRFAVESLAELHYSLEGALQEIITAQSWIEISKRNWQGSWPRPPTI